MVYGKQRKLCKLPVRTYEGAGQGSVSALSGQAGKSSEGQPDLPGCPDASPRALWICIRQDVEWWAENPCLYFEIRPEGVSYGFCLWRPRPSTMETFRKYISDNSREFLKLIKATEKATGLPITADLYKRPKDAPSKELAPYFAWRGNISCVINEEVSPEMFGPDLGARAGAFLEKLIGLYDFFNRFKV